MAEYGRTPPSSIWTSLPQCPVCRRPGDYEILGYRKNHARCKVCHAKWRSDQLTKGPMLSMRLVEGVPFGLWDLSNVDINVDVWRDLPNSLHGLREYWRTEYERMFKGIVVSDAGEKLAMVDPFVGSFYGGRVIAGGDFALEPQPGQLFLTNHRFIWLEGGVHKFDLWYEQLGSLQWGFMKLYNNQKQGMLVKSSDGRVDQLFQSILPSNVSLDNNSFNFLRPGIMTLVERRRAKLQEEARKDRTQIVLDFTSLKAELAKGGVVASTFKCSTCGKMLSIPEAGKVVVCQNCGTPTKAVDLFDRIKTLLG